MPPEPESRSARRAIIRILPFLIVATAVRIVLTLAGWTFTGEPLQLQMWSRWDAPHLLRLAESGYGLVGDDRLLAVFLPGYPLAVAAASLLLRDTLVSGLVVSLLGSVAALWFLHKLATLDGTPEQGRRAVTLLLVFPTAYFLVAPYSESLFLGAVTASVYAARRGRWGWAACAGALATATRISGVVLLPALAVEAVRGTSSLAEPSRRLAWASLAGSGFIAYLAVNIVVYGDPFAFVDVQASHWHNRLTWPWRSLSDAIVAVAEGGLSTDRAIVHWGRLAGAGATVLLLLAGRGRLAPADHVYGWTALILFLSSTWLVSLPRYLLTIYPIFLVGAALTRRRAVWWPTLAVCSFLQMWLFWRFIRGAWTF